MEDQLNEKIEIEYLKAHRWLFAQKKVLIGKSFLNIKDDTLSFGVYVEAVFNSGLKIVEFINSTI